MEAVYSVRVHYSSSHLPYCARLCEALHALVELVERGIPMRKAGSSILGRVKPMTYKMRACHFLVWGELGVSCRMRSGLEADVAC